MKRKVLWLVVSNLMVLSLLMTACGPAAAPPAPTTPTAPARTAPAAPVSEKPQQEAVKATAEAPRYGGTLNLLGSDPTMRYPLSTHGGSLTNEELWGGDWTKGPAGGYGTSQTGWTEEFLSDIFDHKAGYIAESWKWTADWDKSEGTIVYEIRRGIHYALNPASEASRLVNGRELTVDDVIFAMTQVTQNPKEDLYARQPELRASKITKSGPWEVTVKLPVDALISGISRFGDSMRIVPPEVFNKYGSMNDWKNSVGTGPFILTDYTPGSVRTFRRSDNYWMKDPIGPGKGNQLPYLDGVRYLIIPDKSTQMAALRTGKIDRAYQLNLEDSADMRKTTPQLLEVEAGNAKVSGSASAGYFRTDKPPFTDIRVRRALMMATDFEAIRKSLGHGLGQILTFPFAYTKEYADLYIGLDDPEMPASVKELYVYSPEKARQLLKEAGYPNGFKTNVILSTTEVDFYSILKDMWIKVGIDLELRVKESGTISIINRDRTHDAFLAAGGQGPVAIFYNAVSLTGQGWPNMSVIDDPVINKAVDEIRRACITDLREGMRLMRKITPYVLDQAYVIPIPTAPVYTFWWPWLKNYSGEHSIGYGNSPNFAQFIWVDQEMKRKMGY